MGNNHSLGVFWLGNGANNDRSQQGTRGGRLRAVSEPEAEESIQPPYAPSRARPSLIARNFNGTQEQTVTAVTRQNEILAKSQSPLSQSRAETAPQKRPGSRPTDAKNKSADAPEVGIAVPKLPWPQAFTTKTVVDECSKHMESGRIASLSNSGIFTGTKPVTLSADRPFLRTSSPMLVKSNTTPSNVSRRFTPSVTSDEIADEMASGPATAAALGMSAVKDKTDTCPHVKDTHIPNFGVSNLNDTSSFCVQKSLHRGTPRAFESDKRLASKQQQQPQDKHQGELQLRQRTQQPQKDRQLAQQHGNQQAQQQTKRPIQQQQQQLQCLPQKQQQLRDQQQQKQEHAFVDEKWPPFQRNKLLGKKEDQQRRVGDKAVSSQDQTKDLSKAVKKRRQAEIPAEVPSTNHTCRSGDLVTDIFLLALGFQVENHEWTVPRKAWSWPHLKTSCVLDPVGVKKEARKTTATNTGQGSGGKRWEVQRNPSCKKKTPKTPRKKNLSATRQETVLTGLEEKVAATNLHTASTPGLWLKDLETYNKLLRKQFHELVLI